MTKIITSVVLSVFLITGCRFSAQKDKKDEGSRENDTYEYFVAPVGPENPRNSEADIIELKDGSLLLGWTDFYEGDAADHGPARIVGKISTDGGRNWGEKYTLIENDGGRNVMEVNFMRLKNDDIAIFYCRKETQSTDCRVMMQTSSDEGKTWGNPKQLSPSGNYTGLTNGRSIRLRTGRILLETWVDNHDDEASCYCLITDDEGETWRTSEYVKPAGGGCWENVCIELKDGKVLMLLRTQLGSQYKCISSDGGETWSEPVPTMLTGSAAPAALTRVPKTGDILVIWTHNPDAITRAPDAPGYGRRNPLTSAISKDEGETWENFKNLEEVPDDAWAYPAVTWVDSRALVTYFNYKGGLSLKLKSLPATWFYE